MLQSLLQRRKLLDYTEFRREFDRAARRIDHTACGHIPPRATYLTWLNTGAAPHDEFRRQVLESMFPGWTVEQLFAGTDQELARDPNPPAPATTGHDPDRPAESPATPQQLGALLRRYRTDAQVTLSQVAGECLIDRTLVNKVELGTRTQPRRFWAEVDVMLAADGELLTAYDHYQHANQPPARTVRVLAHGMHRDPVQVHDTISPDELKPSQPQDPTQTRSYPTGPARHLRAVPDPPKSPTLPPVTSGVRFRTPDNSSAEVRNVPHLPRLGGFHPPACVERAAAWELKR